MRSVVVGVGSNLGAREAAIRAARELLDSREDIRVTAVSEIYQTEPLGPPQPSYLNAAYRLETTLSPPMILRTLLRTERRLARVRNPNERWGPRSIDLDLLWDARGEHESPGLQVPHRELRSRNFALAPLLDVAPELASEWGGCLLRTGGRPPIWNRQTLLHVERSSSGLEVDVHSDSLADACAIGASALQPHARPRATLHFQIQAGLRHFETALRSAIRSGFSVACATMSHHSDEGWDVQFHGANAGFASGADVRLWTTSPKSRAFGLRVSSQLTPP